MGKKRLGKQYISLTYPVTQLLNDNAKVSCYQLFFAILMLI